MEAFLSALAETRDCETALAVLTRFARHWRFDCIAIGELPAPGSSRLKPFFFTNWPKSWFEAYVEEGIGGDDPVVTTARQALLPFTWSDIRDNLERWNLKHDDLRGFDLALDHGWSDGLAVPVHRPDGYHGLVSYAGNPGPLAAAAVAELAMMALTAHEHMLALHEAEPQGRNGAGAAELNVNEARTLQLLAEGFDDREIAVKLGVAERSVLYYVKAAKKKLGCRSRAHMIAVAAKTGLIRC